MTAKHDPDRLIRAFLDEGTTELPDRTFDTVRAAIERTHQRVVSGPWREPRMSTISRLLTIAAVIVIAVGVIALVPRSPGVGGNGTPEPTLGPTPIAPTSGPSADPNCSLVLTTPDAGGSTMTTPYSIQMWAQAYPIFGARPDPNPVQPPYAHINFKFESPKGANGDGLKRPTVGVVAPTAGAKGFGTLEAESYVTPGASGLLGTFLLDAPGEWELQIDVPVAGCSLRIPVTVRSAPS